MDKTITVEFPSGHRIDMAFQDIKAEDECECDAFSKQVKEDLLELFAEMREDGMSADMAALALTQHVSHMMGDGSVPFVIKSEGD